MNLYLLRHTQPDVAPGICYGQTDLGLAASFDAELQRIRAGLAEVHVDHVHSSPLQRCQRLAAALAAGKVHQDPRLMELDFGEWELQLWETIPRGLVEVWTEDYVQHAPPGGESFFDLQQRAISFFDEVSANNEDLLVVTHAGVIRALLAHALNMQLLDAFRLRVDYGSLSQLELQDGRVTVSAVNRRF
ncbi:alpha-ribazole phosphatase [Pseudomethylobacillus aquaticus]|uniref:Alpha-ribazole phosphatase n=1 Tax=Pseudomethylobacillus aquaticus TaxID=2676064 RepID=A0A3N0UZ16_9PROT|nr:alpha-ribazole phosphatase [Pseudomethylobacillus aquaticus]ROH85787.1 alpha-ribazole phosphatase [Pseudomethylobacillus aquaticus]